MRLALSKDALSWGFSLWILIYLTHRKELRNAHACQEDRRVGAHIF